MFFNMNEITPYNVVFPNELIFPSGNFVLTLTDIKPVKKYLNGKATEEIEGNRFFGLTEEGKLTSVKVLSDTPIKPEELIKNINTTVNVKFTGVTVKIYVNKNNRAAFSVQAETVEVVK